MEMGESVAPRGGSPGEGAWQRPRMEAGAARVELASRGDEPGVLRAGPGAGGDEPGAGGAGPGAGGDEPGAGGDEPGAGGDEPGAGGDEHGVLRGALGVLRNGLGSLENLELLIKSIKVGQKGLFAAVAAVHADCAPMIASAAAIGPALHGLGVDVACAQRLSGALVGTLTELEGMLARAVAARRLSTAQRLELERDLSRCSREVGAALPLVALLERASLPGPGELTPLSLLYESSGERSGQKGVLVYRDAAALGAGPAEDVAAGAASHAVAVDLEAAQALVALGVALLLEPAGDGHPRLGLELGPGGAPVTTIRLGGAEGAGLLLPALRVSPPAAACAEVAARRLGARFEHDRDARRVCIYWPLS